MMVLYAHNNKFDEKVLRNALQRIDPAISFLVVNDVGELLDTLSDLVQLPDLIIVRADMPDKKVEACLIYLKNNPAFRRVPVGIIAETIDAEELHLFQSLGVNFINHPNDFNSFFSQAIRVAGI